MCVRARGKSAVSGADRPPQAKLDFRLHSLSPNSHTYCSTVLLNTCGVQRTAPRQWGVQSARWFPGTRLVYIEEYGEKKDKKLFFKPLLVSLTVTREVRALQPL